MRNLASGARRIRLSDCIIKHVLEMSLFSGEPDLYISVSPSQWRIANKIIYAVLYIIHIVRLQKMLYQFVRIFTTMALQMLSFKHTSDTHYDTDISQTELYTYMNKSMRTHHTDPHLRATFVLQILWNHLIRTAIQLSGFYQLGNIFTFVGKYMQQAHEVIIIV